MDTRLSRHIQQGSAEPAGTSSSHACPPARTTPLRSGRIAISAYHGVAGKRRANRAPVSATAFYFLFGAAVHPQRHTRGYADAWVFAERAAIRSRGMRRTDYFRPLAWAGNHFQAGFGNTAGIHTWRGNPDTARHAGGAPPSNRREGSRSAPERAHA